MIHGSHQAHLEYVNMYHNNAALMKMPQTHINIFCHRKRKYYVKCCVCVLLPLVKLFGAQSTREATDKTNKALLKKKLDGVGPVDNRPSTD